MLLAHEIEHAAQQEALGIRESAKSERGASPLQLSGSQNGTNASEHSRADGDVEQAATPGPAEDVKMEA